MAKNTAITECTKLSSSAHDYDDYTPRQQYPVIGLNADYGLVDGKGRRVGGFAILWGKGGQWSLNVGATRDGKRFGASTRSTVHATETAGRTAALKKFRAQRARYAKTCSAAEGGAA